MKTSIFSLCLVVYLSIFAQDAYGNSNGPMSINNSAGEPLWELGIFTAAFHGPLYPAAKDYQSKLVPVPLFIYRGETIRLGDNSFVKAVAVEKERFKLDVSLSGAFNADSTRSKIRKGMPDLDFMFELGPEASLLLFDNSEPTGDSELWLNLPLRSVFSTDVRTLNHRGYVFQPELAFTTDNLFFDDSRFFFSVAPIFTTDKTQAYFYDVAPQYSRVDRAFYQSHGGYLGTELSIANRVYINKQWMLFAAAQIGLWQGGKNVDSPLHQEDIGYSFALGVKWTLMSSSENI